jgi:hypothetical protein
MRPTVASWQLPHCFPSPAEVEASTPPTRDRAIDVIRIVSLVGVVVGHTLMATSTLYLWHIPPLLAMHLIFDYLGRPRFDPSSPGFIALSVVQLLIMGVLVALVFVAVMLTALIAARCLASDRQRVCAASLPARTT